MSAHGEPSYTPYIPTLFSHKECKIWQSYFRILSSLRPRPLPPVHSISTFPALAVSVHHHYYYVLMRWVKADKRMKVEKRWTNQMTNERNTHSDEKFHSVVIVIVGHNGHRLGMRNKMLMCAREASENVGKEAPNERNWCVWPTLVVGKDVGDFVAVANAADVDGMQCAKYIFINLFEYPFCDLSRLSTIASGSASFLFNFYPSLINIKCKGVYYMIHGLCGPSNQPFGAATTGGRRNVAAIDLGTWKSTSIPRLEST